MYTIGKRLLILAAAILFVAAMISSASTGSGQGHRKYSRRTNTAAPLAFHRAPVERKISALDLVPEERGKPPVTGRTVSAAETTSPAALPSTGLHHPSREFRLSPHNFQTVLQL